MSESSSSRASVSAPIDITHHLSELTKQRAGSQIKRFYKYFQIPGIGQLAGGLPFHEYFPFDTLESSTARPDRWQPSEHDQDRTSHDKAGASKTKAARIIVPHDTAEPNQFRKVDVKTALQYGQASGLAPLASWVQQFVTEAMIPEAPYTGGLATTMTLGNTDGFSKALEALSNTWIEGRQPIGEREGILCEEYTFMGGVSTARARGLNITPIKADHEGMLAYGKGGLADILVNWDASTGQRPHLMYTVTIGQNPTGAIMGPKRRKEIYELCVKYDIIIIEDEPYWYLQYPSAMSGTHLETRSSTGSSFLDSLLPSYLAGDYQGRVVRLDTFSKTVAPGCRLGWLTAQPTLIERIQRITESSTAGPSGFVQSLIAELILGPDARDSKNSAKSSGWNNAGWCRWLEGLRGNYERRMNTMCDILDQGRDVISTPKRLRFPSSSTIDSWDIVEKTPAYRFNRPGAGMFVWIEVLYENHPLTAHFAPADLAAALWVLLTHKPYLVLVMPGAIFGPTVQIVKESGWKFFRLSFCADEDEVISRSTTGFINGVAAFWQMRDRDEVQALIDEAHAEDIEREMAAMSPGFC